MTTTTTATTTTATLDEFVWFHGMLSRPSSAMRCIRAFSVIIFAPSDYNKTTTTCKGSDVGMIARYHVTGLDLARYYALVIYSMTFLSTLLGMTTFIEGIEDHDGLHAPEVTHDILEFVAERAQCMVEDIRVIRRFHYVFALPGINVKMWHLWDGTRLHLVEIYQREMHVWRVYYGIAAVIVLALSYYFYH